MIEFRIADETHIPALAGIERASAERFGESDLPIHLREETVSEEEHLDAQRQGLLLVALEDEAKPVGFAITRRIESCLHIVEMDVHPRYQRRGIGSSLLDQVAALARVRGCEAVTLTTFRHVAWNAPWYGRRGFTILKEEEIPRSLRCILDEEQAKGLRQRVAMRKAL